MTDFQRKLIFEKIRELFDDEHVAEMALLFHHLANSEERSDDFAILELLLDSSQASFYNDIQ